jgi:gamma-carbonic anhydrase
MVHKIIKFKNLEPKIHGSVYVAQGAVIAADVTIAANANIWFNAVIRGDVAPVSIGENTNIQDGCVVHTSRFDGPTNIGSNITIGHMALIHACTIEDNAFIGMQAAIMDKAIVEEYGFVGAGSLLPPGKVVKRKELWVGSPAKFVRYITDEELDFMRGNIENYVELAQEYKK